MVSVFQEVLQSYYTPAVALLIFAGILVSDQLLSRKEKLLFLMALVVVGTLRYLALKESPGRRMETRAMICAIPPWP